MLHLSTSAVGEPERGVETDGQMFPGMRPRVLILASWFPDERSPLAGIFVLEQAQLLSERYEVAVLVPSLVKWRHLLKRTACVGARVETTTGLPVYREPSLSLLPGTRTSYSRYCAAAARGFRRLERSWGQPALIHAHVVLPGGWSAVNLGKRHGVPVVITEHSSPFSMHLGTSPKQQMVRFALSQADSVLAVSPALAEQIQTFDSSVTVRVVGNVVRTSFFTPQGEAEGPESRPLRFLCVGLLSKQKGFGYLLEAVSRLQRLGYTAFELAIGGDGKERQSLAQRAQALRVSERCTFLGLLDREAVRTWLRWTDVLVLPSLHETFGIVLGEAMACGKPVIATRCGGPEYVVTPDTGVLVEPGNAEALVEAMAAFLEGRVCFDSRTIRRSVEQRFGEQAFLGRLSGVYEETLADFRSKSLTAT